MEGIRRTRRRYWGRRVCTALNEKKVAFMRLNGLREHFVSVLWYGDTGYWGKWSRKNASRPRVGVCVGEEEEEEYEALGS